MIWLTILSILRSIFAAIDRIVAWAIENVYVMIVQLANIRLFDGEILETFANRINILLGLFMLFWLAFRIVKYVINPDLSNDSQQGFGKIIVNVVVMLAMLVLVNYGFQAMYGLQNQIFKSDVLPNLIFGLSNRDMIGEGEDSTRQTGKKIAFYIYSAFAYPKSGVSEPLQNSCENFLSLKDEELGTCLDNVEYYTSPAMADKLSESLTEYDVEKLMASDLMTAREGEKFIMNYTFIISTICGVVAVIVLVQIAIDVAIRIAKLGLLQLIAPIPIISYIDPISGKNGIFMNWLKEVGKTFASVFIKLASVYFAVFLIMMTVSSHAYMGADIAGIAANEKITISNHPLLTIMIIIGALLFAKELPKLISQIFGVKLDGGGWGFAKRGVSALGAATLGAVGGGLAGAYAGARTDGFKGMLKHGMGGMLGAGGRGALGGMKGQKVMQSASSGIRNSNSARNANAAYRAANMKGVKGYLTRGVDQLNEWAGYQNAAGEFNSMESKLKELNIGIENNNAQESALRMSAANIAGNSGMSGTELLQKYDSYAQARDSFAASLEQYDISDETRQKHMANWEERYGAEYADAKKYKALNDQINALDADTKKKRDDAKVYQRALDERSNRKKKGGK